MYVVDVPIGEGAGDGEDPEVIRVEVRELDEGLVRVGRSGRQTAARATRSFDDMLSTVRPVAMNFVNTFRGAVDAPDEITVQFGISLSAEADVVIASTATAANFSVSLTWNRSPPEGPRPE
ncbi:CU044_2847 family protein [Streptomyces sp. NPDC002055]|uniref:CU044_2847 family protein n=1 Tax=Streptomyces sp. NPDC002055 TaxID=3154534 RepID=UPI003331DD4B